MHLLNAQSRRVDDGDDAVDLNQSPADVIILSCADTELAALVEARRNLGDEAAFPSLRLANLMALKHPYSIDLYIQKTVCNARLVIIRALGGESYWSYALEQIRASVRATGGMLVVLPGDPVPDPSLEPYNNVDVDLVELLSFYFKEGGPGNFQLLLKMAFQMLEREPDQVDCVSAIALPDAGYYFDGQDMLTLDSVREGWKEGRPVAVITFYRALVQGGSLAPVDALVEALTREGLNVLPIYIKGLKDQASKIFIAGCFEIIKPDIVLNATAFAVGDGGEHFKSTVLDAPGSPVLQVIFSSSDESAWRESSRGLSVRDLSMSVVLPELDGRILTRAVSFKAELEHDVITQFKPVTYVPLQDRIDFVSKQARMHVNLAIKPNHEKRVALIFANYPNKDSRLANGVGLDSPASAVIILKALDQCGYRVENYPANSAGIMELILSGQTNNISTDRLKFSTITLSKTEYYIYFKELNKTAQEEIQTRWGAIDNDPFFHNGAFHLAIHRFGNVIIAVQPARGFNIDPKETYHSPDLIPPHNYFAAYFWMRHVHQTDAVINVGKHGNLEWLPGKALALSDACYPELTLGPVPGFYPFIVNDPGEGTQAKRRTSAVIIDHLTPPLTRAESHGAANELEALADEYYLASGVDPARLQYLERELLDCARRHGFDQDCGISEKEDAQSALQKIDTYLCDIKELQIRDGLHIFGIAPKGQLQNDLLLALARLPRATGQDGDQSLTRALALDLGLDEFDPLGCDLGLPYEGPKPDELNRVNQDIWRINGDTVERLEILALALVSGEIECPNGWVFTKPVLRSISDNLRPKIEACGPREISSLLAGLDGKFVAPGPSGAPTRGRLDVLPTGKNFFSIDVRAVPSKTAWALGQLSASLLVDRYMQDEGNWPSSVVITAWGTSNMRTSGDDIAQALALLGARPVWDAHSARVTGFEIIELSELDRPRVDVTLRVSGFFRDAFPHQIDLFDSVVQDISKLDEPESANPLAARVRNEIAELQKLGVPENIATRRATHRVFGSKPGAYGAGLQTLIDEDIWDRRDDFAEAFLAWGSYAYGGGSEGENADEELRKRLSLVDAVIQNQDNREHDLLDSDDYYQFEGGLSATVEHLSGTAPVVYHNDHSRPEKPVIRTLSEELGRVVRGRASNPKWIAGVMRHGYKGAFEIAATVDYLYAFAATTPAVKNHHFDQLYSAYIEDKVVRDFIKKNNPAALSDILSRFQDAIERGLWQPRRNSTHFALEQLQTDGKTDG